MRVEFNCTVSGIVGSAETPDWTALEQLIGPGMLGCFFWMFEVELEDGARVEVYKHRTTRRYLHLADDGRAFDFTRGGRYREVDRQRAIVAVFGGPLPRLSQPCTVPIEGAAQGEAGLDAAGPSRSA